jgi:hypothetical protein
MLTQALFNTRDHEFGIIHGLQEEVILGTNFLQHHSLLYDSLSQTLLQEGSTRWDTSIISSKENTTLATLSTIVLRV